ncbi:type I-C CRISPR-associated endonuclease Cas1c [Parabacteroides chinchillae]
MRKLLNTLYVTTPEAYLSKEGLNVVISVNQTEIFRIPILNIESIVTFGYMGASPGLMKLCCDNNVSLVFLSPNGRYVGRLQGPVRGNVLLRNTQFRLSSDKDFALNVNKIFIGAKIQNYRSILQRYMRDYGAHEEITKVSDTLKMRKQQLFCCTTADQLRGIEGDAAKSYFDIFSYLIVNQKNDFVFQGRNRRPPKDAVNALLSFVYTLIANDIEAALETIGLDPYVGFLHTLRPGRPSLALDLMEEFRAYLGDRLVLSLINRKQVTIKDFVKQGDEGIIMTDSCRKEVLQTWQKRKKEIINHPYLNEKVPIGLLPYVQAMLLARYLRGDLDNYPVFLIR